MKLKAIFLCCFLCFTIEVSNGGIIKKLHEGVYQNIKGSVDGAKEVIGTPVKLEDVHFFLVKKSNQNDSRGIEFNPLEPEIAANKEGRTFILVHGWFSSTNTSGCRKITNALLNTYPDSYVLQVDWEKSARDAYPFSAFSTESVGEIVGNLINKLVSDYKVPLKNVVIMGHSLGGQICGWAGKQYKKITNKMLERIIALDPAGPLFISRPDSKRLNKNDAKVVQVIHTDGGKLGFQWSCGTIDFFPNGGSSQPGCYQVDLAKLSTLADPVTCDHSRVWDAMAEAIEVKGSFEAEKCENFKLFEQNKCNSSDTAFMGDLTIEKEGKYYLITNSESPFSKLLTERPKKKTLW